MFIVSWNMKDFARSQSVSIFVLTFQKCRFSVYIVLSQNFWLFSLENMRFEVIVGVKMLLVFLVVKPCSLRGGYKHFGGTNCFHLQSLAKLLSTYMSTKFHSEKSVINTSKHSLLQFSECFYAQALSGTSYLCFWGGGGYEKLCKL